MRRLPNLPLALIAALVVVVIAACSSGAAPAWTYAPAASTTAAASGAASGAPSGGPAGSAPAVASTAPSVQPSAGGSAGSSGSPGGVTVTITAHPGAATAGFDPNKLDGPANAPFTVVFDNEDTTTSPHNWVLMDSTGAKVQIGGDTSFFSGPAKHEYQIPALAPGDYPFKCEIHPTVMTGTLTVK